MKIYSNRFVGFMLVSHNGTQCKLVPVYIYREGNGLFSYRNNRNEGDECFSKYKQCLRAAQKFIIDSFSGHISNLKMENPES